MFWCAVIGLAAAFIAFVTVTSVDLSQNTKGIIIYVIGCIAIYVVYSIFQIAKDEKCRATQDWLDRFEGE
jgi:predicted membrane channel-forming protein YqfA (hemolysin III family)